MQENGWALAMDEFIHIGGWLLLIIAVVSIITGLVRQYIPQEKLQQKLRQHESRGPLIGAFMGLLTPFCSAAMIPVVIGMVQMGIATGTVFSFLISAPLANFVVVGLIMATFGIKVAAIYFVLVLAGAITAGYLIGFTKLRHEVKRDLAEPAPTFGVSPQKNKMQASKKEEEYGEKWTTVADSNSAIFKSNNLGGLATCSTAPTCNMPSAIPTCSVSPVSVKIESHKERVRLAMRFAWALFKKIVPWVLLGAAISALSAAFLPANIVERFVGSDKWFAIPLTAIISIPLYLRIEMALPLLDVLIGKGMGMGAAMALIIGGTGASLPEIAIISTVLKPKAVAAFVTIVLAMAIIGGVLFSFVI